MRFGIQTILWGLKPADYSRMLDIIEDAGFEGVEFFQHPRNLPPLRELLRLLCERKRPLALLGLSGGNLKTRVAYLNQDARDWCAPECWNPKAPYLYVDEWSEEAATLLKDGYQLAVHPHYLKQISSASDAFELLKKHPGLLYIPDTAHSEIKREDIIRGLSKHSDRLAAVHLKDWRPGFGRASALYARGFTELGRGTVNLEQVLRYLQKNIRYQGWVVVEQDYTEGLAEGSVQDSARWLARRTELRPSLLMSPRPLQQTEFIDQSAPITVNAVHFFSTQRFASQDVGQIYQRIAEALAESLRLKAVAIWSCSELERILTLQGLAPSPQPEDASLTVAYEEFQSLDAGWLEPAGVHPAVQEAIDNVIGGGRAFRLPVQSTWNPHQVRIVVDLFTENWPTPSPESQNLLSQSVARVFDTHLDRISFSSAADLNLEATLAGDERDFGSRLKSLVRRRLQCDAVALFRTDRSGTRLKPFVSPELEWRDDLHPSECYYEDGDGQLTTLVWQSREPQFRNRKPAPAREKVSKCILPSNYKSHDRVLAMPIVDIKGEAIGLVRCVNKVTAAGNVCNFSDDDLVVLDHIIQQAIPTLRLRNAAEEEQQRLLIVAHELKRPVSALCGFTDLMTADVEDEKTRTLIPERTRRQILGTSRWSENLRALVLRSRYLTGTPDKQFVVLRQKTELMGEIVASTISQLRWEIRERGLPQSEMVYDSFHQIPPLFVDRNMFQQIFFNLLDNAIKYAKDDSSEFRVDIASGDEGDFFTIKVIDHGKGIPKAMAPHLFKLGVRGPEAFRSADGAGVGLWLVSQLLELHGGTIKVERYADPTILRIELPRKLATENWKP